MAVRAKRFESERVARLASVTLGGVPAFGTTRELTLELEPGVTVLVGRNGAGKSAILTGITTMPSLVLGDRSVAMWPREDRSATFELNDPEVGKLTYTCTRELIPTDEGQVTRWRETCSAGAVTRWVQSKGRVKANNVDILVPEGVSYLGIAPPSPEGRALLDLFRSLTIVPSGLPRASLDEPSLPFFSVVRVQGMDLVDRPRDRVRGLLSRLVSWHLKLDPALDELNSILQRLTLLRSPIQVVVVPLPKAFESHGQAETWAHVQAEGHLDLLALSDGTLRVIEILASVLGSAPGSVTLIEEPETGIHPGLLGKVVDELKAYAHDRQIVIATHSSDLVSKFGGKALRLVSRVEGAVRVRKVTAPEAKRVKAFLQDGNLGDFVFGGGLGEDDEG